MFAFRYLILAVGLAHGTVALSQSDTAPGTVTCGSRSWEDQCRITWNLPRPSFSYFWVQKFDPQSAEWRYVDGNPVANIAQGSRDGVVEGGFLYRVIACDDDNASANCTSTTMVWAPFVQPPDQVQLIPSVVASTGPRGGYVGAVAKNQDWLTQVIQYNVYQFMNAIARAKLPDLPKMTPAPDLQTMAVSEIKPLDQVMFNVYAVYLAEAGTPLEMPEPPPAPRRPHLHPERHPQ